MTSKYYCHHLTDGWLEVRYFGHQNTIAIILLMAGLRFAILDIKIPVLFFFAANCHNQHDVKGQIGAVKFSILTQHLQLCLPCLHVKYNFMKVHFHMQFHLL